MIVTTIGFVAQGALRWSKINVTSQGNQNLCSHWLKHLYDSPLVCIKDTLRRMHFEMFDRQNYLSVNSWFSCQSNYSNVQSS